MLLKKEKKCYQFGSGQLLAGTLVADKGVRKTYNSSTSANLIRAFIQKWEMTAQQSEQDGIVLDGC
jgi:hypothetical protein